MGFDIHWFVQGRIIKVNAMGDITIEDLQNASNIILEMFEETDAPLVHIITDETAIDSLPNSLKSYSESSEFMHYDRMGWLLVYPSNHQMSKFLTGTVAGIAKIRYRRFETLENSLQFLVSVDTSLPSVEEMLDY